MNRRGMMVAGLSAAALGGCRDGETAAGGPYPAKNITFIIPSGPGGADVYARLIGAAMEKRLPRRVSIVPTNVPSGGGGKGITQVFRAAADGYTIGFLQVPGIFQLKRVRKLPYDMDRFTWLGSLTVPEHYGLAVGGKSPIRSIDDLKALSRKRVVTFSATGPEGTAYSVTRIGTQMLGLRTRLVSGYRGSNDYVIGAMRGDADAVVAALSVLNRMKDGGALRVLATFETKGSLPGVPDATALGAPDLDRLTSVRLVAAPPGLPPAIRQMLGDALAGAAADPTVISYAKKIGEKLAPKGPDETGALVRRQLEFFNSWPIA